LAMQRIGLLLMQLLRTASSCPSAAVTESCVQATPCSFHACA
jgi:hypothetical protein